MLSNQLRVAFIRHGSSRSRSAGGMSATAVSGRRRFESGSVPANPSITSACPVTIQTWFCSLHVIGSAARRASMRPSSSLPSSATRFRGKSSSRAATFIDVPHTVKKYPTGGACSERQDRLDGLAGRARRYCRIYLLERIELRDSVDGKFALEETLDEKRNEAHRVGIAFDDAANHATGDHVHDVGRHG